MSWVDLEFPQWSQSSSNRYMKIAKEIPNFQHAGNLETSLKALPYLWPTVNLILVG